MRVDGQCHCGRIAYEAQVDPAGVVICHCTDCQALSGSPYRASIAALGDSFSLLRGAPKVYVKIADSGARRAHGFCEDCGSPIYATDADKPGRYALRVGGLRQRHELTPARRNWTRSELEWSQDISGLPASPQGATAR